MSASGAGAGSLLEPEDLVRPISAPMVAEHAILSRIRSHVTLRALTTAANRDRHLINELAIVTNAIRMQIANVLHSFLQGNPVAGAHVRHRPIITAIDIIYDLCDDISVLSRWKYSLEQQNLIRSRLGVLTGWGRTRLRSNIADLALPSVHRAQEEEEGTETSAPFLLPLLFAIQSTEFPLLPLAASLAAAARGHWDQSKTIFIVSVPEVLSMHDLAETPEWGIRTRPMISIGTVRLKMRTRILSFTFDQPWPAARFRRAPKFLPQECQVAALGPKPPESRLLNLRDRDCTYLSLALGEWKSVMGTLSAELRIILEGGFAISRENYPLVPVFFKNHPSWETNEEARKALWPVIAQYLVMGQFEYVSEHDPMPLCILPIGAVTKTSPPFWRLIFDCRYTNQFIDPWPVKYLSTASLSLMLGKNSIFFVLDLKAAYLLTEMIGCGGPSRDVFRMALNAARDGYVQWKSKKKGCSPSTCGGICDKSAIAICVDGHIMRAACTPFGMSVSHGPLTIITDALVQYVVRRKKLGMGCFVDVLICIIAVFLHLQCGGLLGGCPFCGAAVPGAAEAQRMMYALLDQLHLETSDKCFTFAQQGVYIGIMIDTNRGLYTLLEKKVFKLVQGLTEALKAVRMTPRECSKVRGRLQTYSFCLQRIRPFVIPFNQFIGGPKNNREWDMNKLVTNAMRDAADFLLKHMKTLVSLGAPIWPQQASTVYDLFMRKRHPPSLQASIAVLTSDSARPGTGMSHRETPDEILKCLGKRYDAITSVATFPHPLSAQVHRETMGCWINLDTYSTYRNIGAKALIIRNDSQSGLYGLQKGSNSAPIQYASLQIHKLCSLHRARSFSHVPPRLWSSADRGGTRRWVKGACR